jgi:O-antigen ligase
VTGRPLRLALLGAFVLGLGFSITLSQAALVALTLVWLRRLRDPGVRGAAPLPLAGPVLAFLAATLLSALASGDAVASLVAAKGVLLMVTLWVTKDALEDGSGADRFLSALLVVGAVAAGVGLVQVLACPATPPAGLAARFFHRCDRARGLFSIYMTLAGVLTVVLLAAAPRLLPGSVRRWAIAPWLVMVLGLAATYVRGAWLGFGAGLLALLPMIRRGRLLLVVGLAALVALALGPAPLRHRLLSMGDPEEATIKERRYMVQSGLAMAREHPVLGLGPGGVKREYARFALPDAIKKRTSHLHNTPLQILVERGLLGLAAWIWIWVAFFLRAGAVLRGLGPEAAGERALVAGSMAAVTGFLVAGLSEYNFGDAEVVLVAWTVMALPFVVAPPARE